MFSFSCWLSVDCWIFTLIAFWHATSDKRVIGFNQFSRMLAKRHIRLNLHHADKTCQHTIYLTAWCFFYSLLSLLEFAWTTNAIYVQHMKTVRWLLLVGKNDFIGKIYYVRVNLLDVRQLKFAYFTWRWWLSSFFFPSYY